MGALMRPLYQAFLKLIPGASTRGGLIAANRSSLAFRLGSGVGHFGVGVVAGVARSSSLAVARQWGRFASNPRVKDLTLKASTYFKVKPPKSVNEMKALMDNNPMFANVMMFALPMVGVEVASYMLSDGSSMGDIYLSEVKKSEEEFFDSVTLEEMDNFYGEVLKLSQYAQVPEILKLGTVGVEADYSHSTHPGKGITGKEVGLAPVGIGAALINGGNDMALSSVDDNRVGPLTHTEYQQKFGVKAYLEQIRTADGKIQLDFRSAADRRAAINVARWAENFFLGPENALRAHTYLKAFLHMGAQDLKSVYEDLDV